MQLQGWKPERREGRGRCPGRGAAPQGQLHLCHHQSCHPCVMIRYPTHLRQGTAQGGRREEREVPGRQSRRRPPTLVGWRGLRSTLGEETVEKMTKCGKTNFPVTRIPIMTPSPAATHPKPCAIPGFWERWLVFYLKVQALEHVLISLTNSAIITSLLAKLTAAAFPTRVKMNVPTKIGRYQRFCWEKKSPSVKTKHMTKKTSVLIQKIQKRTEDCCWR